MILQKIISGHQTGADFAAIDAALATNFPYGGGPAMILTSVAYHNGKRIGEVIIEAIREVVKEPHTFV